MISKYEALQEQIDNQPALGQQKLKAMLRFLQDGQVSRSELEKILTYDYKGKTEEQPELYTTLVGLVIDLYIKNNGQENFLELYNSLQGEPEQVQDGTVKEGEEQSEPTEGNSNIIAPQHTERTPQAVAPRKRMRLASPKPVEEAQEPVVEPVEEVLPIEEVAEVEEVKEQPVAIEPIEPVTYVEPELEDTDLEEEVEEELESAEIEVPEQPEDTEVGEPEEPVAEDDSEPVADAKPRKKGGVLKYIAVGVPTVLAIGGLVFWQVNENNKASSLAEQEVVKILEEAPKKEETATALSSGEFDNNVKALTTAIDTIKQNDKTGLSGYFTFEDKRYIIQKYDQSGTLTVFDPKGEKVVYNDEWVQKFIENSKAKAKKTENKKEEKPKSSDDSSKKENKKDADSNAVQTKKKEGSN
jgi:mature-parasite-infected erythrocyte surface antigen